MISQTLGLAFAVILLLLCGHEVREFAGKLDEIFTQYRTWRVYLNNKMSADWWFWSIVEVLAYALSIGTMVVVAMLIVLGVLS